MWMWKLERRCRVMGEYQGCHKCKYGNNQPTEYPCLECEHNRAVDNYEPMTNADAIRNMTDGELADFLVRVNGAYAKDCMVGIEVCKYEYDDCADMDCVDCFLEWLQAEVKEGADNG